MKLNYYAERRFCNRFKDIYRLKIKNTKNPHPYLEQARFFIHQIHTKKDEDIYFLAKHPREQRDLISTLPFSKTILSDVKLSKILDFGETNDLYVSIANYTPSNILTSDDIFFAKNCTDDQEKNLIYKSQKIKPRSNTNVASSDAIIIDIDYYKIFQLNCCTPEEVLAKIESEVFLSLNIKPHFTIYSGRGLQLVFLLENVLLFRNIEKQNMYKEVIKALVTLLLPYGSDKACTDMARIFRVPGTKNLKSWKYSYIIDFENIKETKFQRYSLEFLHSQLCNSEEISEKCLKKPTAVLKTNHTVPPTIINKSKNSKVDQSKKTPSEKKHNISKEGMKNILTARSKNFKQKCFDLEIWLIAHYDDMEHIRNIFFDIYASCLVHWVVNNDYQLNHLKSINNLLKNPLHISELERILNNSRKAKYLYSKKTIMEKLNFTEIDYIGKSVLYLDTPETLKKKQELKNENAKKNRRNINGLTQREQQKIDNISSIKELLKENKSVPQIIAITGLKKTAIYSYIKKIKSFNSFL